MNGANSKIGVQHPDQQRMGHDGVARIRKGAPSFRIVFIDLYQHPEPRAKYYKKYTKQEKSP
jgi:hypothetical protein